MNICKIFKYCTIVLQFLLIVGLLPPVSAAEDEILVEEKAAITLKGRLATRRNLKKEIIARTNADTIEAFTRKQADEAEAEARKAADKGLLSQVTGLKHTIGETFGGGYVFFVYDDGQHGLIVSSVDLSVSTPTGGNVKNFKWGGFTTGTNPQPFLTNAIADGIGAGKANTTLSIATQIANNNSSVDTPAMLCHFLRVTQNPGSLTFSEWYLPSKFELNLLYKNRNTLPIKLTAASYWSSTEFWNSTSPLGVLPSAWSQSFANGAQTASPKTSTFMVRAIRSF